MRYAGGSSALFRLTSRTRGDQYLHGRHCMGGSWSSWLGACSFATEDDIKTFRKYAHYRDEGLWPSHKPLIRQHHGIWFVTLRVPVGRYSGRLAEIAREINQQAVEFVASQNKLYPKYAAEPEICAVCERGKAEPTAHLRVINPKTSCVIEYFACSNCHTHYANANQMAVNKQRFNIASPVETS